MQFLKTILILAMLTLGSAGFAQEAEQQAEPQVEVKEEAAEFDVKAAIASETLTSRLLQLAAMSRDSKDFEVMQLAAKRLTVLRPHIGAYGFLLARAYALVEKRPEAYQTLLALQKQGLVFDMAGDSDFDNLRGYGLYDFVQEGFQTNAETIGRARKEIELHRSDLLIDGLVYDPKREQFLVGSVTQGAVYLVSKDGTLEELIKADNDNGLLGVFDMALDAERRALWVTSVAVAHYEGVKFQDTGRAGVFKFDLDSGEMLQRFEAPRQANMKLTNIALGPDGTAYVADSATPGVYQISPEDGQIKRFFSARNFTSLRGLTIDPSGEYLFFSDYELGLIGVGITDRKAFAIQGSAEINLGGVDGVYWYGDGLVLIQNGNNPQRVLRVALSPDRRMVVHAQPLLSAAPQFDSPAVATVTGSHLHLMANSHWNYYDAQTGKPREGVNLSAPLILDLDLDADWTAKK